MESSGIMKASLQRDFQSRSPVQCLWSVSVSSMLLSSMQRFLFTFLGSEVTPGYELTSEDLGIGASDERECETLVFLGLFSIHHLPRQILGKGVFLLSLGCPKKDITWPTSDNTVMYLQIVRCRTKM